MRYAFIMVNFFGMILWMSLRDKEADETLLNRLFISKTPQPKIKIT
jgi:hypothetical protein